MSGSRYLPKPNDPVAGYSRQHEVKSTLIHFLTKLQVQPSTIFWHKGSLFYFRGSNAKR